MEENQQAAPIRIDGFKGINNRIDPTRLGLEWQLQADNVVCDDAGFLVRRPGVTDLNVSCKDIFATPDGVLYLIDDDDRLASVDRYGSLTVLFEGVTGAPFRWTQLGEALFVQSDTQQWALYPNRKMVWGALCPEPEETEVIGEPVSYPPPIGHLLAVRRNQIAVAFWEPDRDRSAVFFSRPDFPHEFRLERDFLLIPGRITAMASVSSGFVVGTDRAIFFDRYDAPIAKVADYGVLSGGVVYSDRDTVYLWTERGLCRLAPFENLTDETFVPSPFSTATVGLLPFYGSEYAVVCLSDTGLSSPVDSSYIPMDVAQVFQQSVIP